MEVIQKRGIQGILLLLIPIGIIIGAIAMFVFQPWTSLLGFSFSTERLIAAYIIYHSFIIPGALYFVAWQLRSPQWLAPVGKYTEGQKVNPLSPYHLVAMGVMAALFAATGFVSGLFNIDLASFTAAFTAIYFGPWVTFVALIAGNIVRMFSGTAYWLNPTNVLLNGVVDAGVWAISGGLYWWLIREKRLIKNRWVGLAVFYPVFQLLHAFMWIFLFQFVNNPIEGAIAGMIATLGSWYPNGMAFTIIGLFVGQTLYDLNSMTLVPKSSAPVAPKAPESE